MPEEVTIKDPISGNKSRVIDGNLETRTEVNALKILSTTSYDVDNTAVQVFDASANSSAVAIIICNAGDEDIYLYKDNTAGPGIYFKKLASGETWEFPIGYTSDTTNDIYAERASAQANDNVITVVLGES